MRNVRFSLSRALLAATGAALVLAACAGPQGSPIPAGAAGPASRARLSISPPKAIKQKYYDVANLINATDVAVNKGDLWVGSQCQGIVRVTPKGVGTLFSYAEPQSGCNDPISLTPGIGGDVWFVDGYENAIGRISPRGKIKFYPLPSDPSCNIYPSFPNGITEGPDGAMWFTTQNSGDIFCSGFETPAVGRVTNSGKITLYYTGTTGTEHPYAPSGYITTGADGALYFPSADPYSKLVIGRITTGGAFSFSEEAICPSSIACTPNTDGIAKDRSGDLWVSDYYDGVMIRYTGGSDGVGVFGVPGDTGGNENAIGPRRVTTGPDGAVWFATYTAPKLGRVASDGSIKFYSLSLPPSSPSIFAGITLQKSALWFAMPTSGSGPPNLGEATP